MQARSHARDLLTADAGQGQYRVAPKRPAKPCTFRYRHGTRAAAGTCTRNCNSIPIKTILARSHWNHAQIVRIYVRTQRAPLESEARSSGSARDESSTNSWITPPRCTSRAFRLCAHSSRTLITLIILITRTAPPHSQVLRQAIIVERRQRMSLARSRLALDPAFLVSLSRPLHLKHPHNPHHPRKR